MRLIQLPLISSQTHRGVHKVWSQSENLSEMQILGPGPGLLNVNIWARGSAIWIWTSWLQMVSRHRTQLFRLQESRLVWSLVTGEAH